mgnify:FL=1
MFRNCRCIAWVLLLVLVFGVVGMVQAQKKYPSRPISLICPWAAGGGTDRVARMIAVLLEKELGQPVNVINRTGGGGAVGHSAGATAASNGYTITIGTVEIAMMHWMGLTPISYKDLRCVAQVNFDPAGVMVSSTSPWQTLEELHDAIRANPGSLKASGTAKGGIWDLARAGWMQTLGLPESAVAWVPSTGAATGLQELVAGGVDIVTASLPEGATLIDAGRVRPLAIMSDQRDPLFPDVPTLKDKGLDWALGAWRGIMVPAKTPDDIVAILEEALAKVVASDEYVEFMQNNGFGVVYRDSKAFSEFVAEQDAMFGKLMKDLGLTQ